MCHDTKEDQQRIVEGIASAQQLGSYSAKIGETSVSGISSGAFMTVQLGVAHSADVKGVGVTAGGPYFCAESIFSNELTISKVVACCMQGDPDYLRRRSHLPNSTSELNGSCFKQIDEYALNTTSTDANALICRYQL